MVAQPNNEATLNIAVDLQLARFNKKMAQLQKSLSSKKLKFAGGMISDEIIKTQKQINSLNNIKVKKSSFLNPDVFQGWAMSLMFAGMALQRMSSSLYKFGTKAFQEISHSVEGATTNTDILEGSMKYLGFTVGQALEPVIALLIPIIDKIAEWVEQNPGLVAVGTTILAIGGTIATVGGMFTLAWTNGILPLIDGLKNTNWVALGQQVQKGIGMIAVGFGVAWTADALASMADDSFFETAAKSAGGIITTIGGIRMMMGKGGGIPLILIGVGLKLIGENKFFESVGKIINPLTALFLTAWDRILYNFKDKVYKGILNTLIDLLRGLSILDEIFPKLGAAIDKLQDKIRGEPSTFNATTSYQENLRKLNENTKGLDAYMKGLLNPIEGATFANEVSGNQPVYYINIGEIQAQNLDINEIYDSINRQGGIVVAR